MFHPETGRLRTGRAGVNLNNESLMGSTEKSTNPGWWIKQAFRSCNPSYHSAGPLPHQILQARNRCGDAMRGRPPGDDGRDGHAGTAPADATCVSRLPGETSIGIDLHATRETGLPWSGCPDAVSPSPSRCQPALPSCRANPGVTGTIVVFSFAGPGPTRFFGHPLQRKPLNSWAMAAQEMADTANAHGARACSTMTGPHAGSRHRLALRPEQ